MSGVEGTRARTSKSDVTFVRGPTGPPVEIAPAAIDHILQAGGIDRKFKAEVVAQIEQALLKCQEFGKTTKALTLKQEKKAGANLEAAVKKLQMVLARPVVSRRLFIYQNRDLVRSHPEGARIPRPDLAKQALAEKFAVVEKLGTWAAEMIERPFYPEHARPSPAKSNPARPALTDLSIRIVDIWQKLEVIGAVKKPPTISDTSPFVRFAKEIYGLVELDSEPFETLKTRLKAARAKLAKCETLSGG